MSKVIGEVNLSPSSIEGTPDQVAVHIFEKSFVQVLKSFSKIILRLQRFCIPHFGLALSQLAEFHSTKSLEKL